MYVCIYIHIYIYIHACMHNSGNPLNLFNSFSVNGPSVYYLKTKGFLIF